VVRAYWKPIFVVFLFCLTIVITVLTYDSKLEVENKSAINADEIWVYNCETPRQQPESLMLTCGDGGMRLEGLMWATWGPDGAVGYGTYLENDCTPDCAQGEFLSTSVYLTLRDLTQHKEQNFYRTIEITPAEDEDLPRGQSSIQWDLMDFALMMQEILP